MSCPYCFASDLQSKHRQDMSMANFHRLLNWMKQAGVTMAGFIGGEPTLCPDLPEMIQRTRDSGIAVTLFTNGLFPSCLIPEIIPSVANFVVNYNDPTIYHSQTQLDLLHQNLALLSQSGCRITFSKNFSPGYTGYEYLLKGAQHYDVRTVRYDISRPGSNGENDHFASDKTIEMMKKIVSFVRDCEDRGLKTGLDCCVKYCDLSVADRRYMSQVSMKFTGICHPSIDIHPDLSASYCLPLSEVSVPDVTVFPSKERLTHHFAEAVRPSRFENVSIDCSNCHFFKTRCQGGCLATKNQESRGIQLP